MNITVYLTLMMLIAFGATVLLLPYIIKREKNAGIVGIDVNKKDKPVVPRSGGLAAVAGYAIATFVLSELSRYYNLGLDLEALLVSLSVMVFASFIGLIEDLKGISRREKAIFVSWASLPIIITRLGNPEISTPLFTISFVTIPILYWYILVPLGITGIANAINMSAGYNGLESGEITIIGVFLLIIILLRDPTSPALIILAGTIGCSLGLFVFNKYPSKVFIGDVGTLGLGSALGTAVIIGNIEFLGVICILPTFYELFATIYYGHIKKIERRPACMNPIILDDGRIKPPAGAEKYTLAYFILSKKPMKEPHLVIVLLSIYTLCGFVALGLSMIM